MRPRIACLRAGEAGLTLIEVLVVLAIMALCTGAGVALLRPPSKHLELQAVTRKLCASLRLVRAQAIAANAEAVVTVDLKGNTFKAPGQPVVSLFDDMVLKVTFAGSERVAGATAIFRFFPSGSATGGVIEMSRGDLRSSIAINWLTGEARCGV